MSQHLESLKKIYEEYNLKSLKDNSLYTIKKLPLSSTEIQFIENDMKCLFKKIKSLFEREHKIFKINESLKDVDETVFNYHLVEKYLSLNQAEKKKYLDLLKLIDDSHLEDLKNYIESKKEYNHISKKNQKDKQYISSMFKIDNTPSILPEIAKTISILDKKQATFVFSSEWQKAKKIFQAIYIGKESFLSRQEIKAVLSNEQKIFSPQSDLFDSILHFSESENLKAYLNVKKEHINILNKNKMEKTNISSICQLKDLPKLSEIIKSAYILEKENVFSVFYKKHRLANKIFKKIYVGKKGAYSKFNILKNLYDYLNNLPMNEKKEMTFKKQKDDLYGTLQKAIEEQNNSASHVLKELYDYLENRSANEKREAELKEIKDSLYEKIANQTEIENIDSLLNNTDISQIAQALKVLNPEFIENWLNQPDSLIQYKKLMEDKKELLRSS